MANEISYEIKETIGVLSTSAKGWQKELNLISWKPSCIGHNIGVNIEQSEDRVVCHIKANAPVIIVYPVKRTVQNVIAAPNSCSYIKNIRCPCRNERTEDFLAIRFEQFYIFLCTIVVALYGQPDFFIEISLTELEPTV